MNELEKLKVGDILIADKYSGFPDNTTKGKEYEISKIEEFTNRVMFWITDDNGKECFPISTTFKMKITA